MKKRLLSQTESTQIKSAVSYTWDITKQYWYPLFDCSREDLVAFDSKYVDHDDKINFIKTILQQHGVKNIYEFREDGVVNEIVDFVDYDFWRSDEYFWNNECYWFSNDMDWIIYISHEETITFGGKWLVDKLKKSWTEWKNNISWDTKNKC
jgi:hypothetical protein